VDEVHFLLADEASSLSFFIHLSATIALEELFVTRRLIASSAATTTPLVRTSLVVAPAVSVATGLTPRLVATTSAAPLVRSVCRLVFVLGSRVHRQTISAAATTAASAPTGLGPLLLLGLDRRALGARGEGINLDIHLRDVVLSLSLFIGIILALLPVSCPLLITSLTLFVLLFLRGVSRGRLLVISSRLTGALALRRVASPVGSRSSLGVLRSIGTRLCFSCGRLRLLLGVTLSRVILWLLVVCSTALVSRQLLRVLIFIGVVWFV